MFFESWNVCVEIVCQMCVLKLPWDVCAEWLSTSKSQVQKLTPTIETILSKPTTQIKKGKVKLPHNNHDYVEEMIDDAVDGAKHSAKKLIKTGWMMRAYNDEFCGC